MKNSFLLQSLLMFFLVILTFVFIRGLDGDIIQNEYYNNYKIEHIDNIELTTSGYTLELNENNFYMFIIGDSYVNYTYVYYTGKPTQILNNNDGSIFLTNSSLVTSIQNKIINIDIYQFVKVSDLNE